LPEPGTKRGNELSEFSDLWVRGRLEARGSQWFPTFEEHGVLRAGRLLGTSFLGRMAGKECAKIAADLSADPPCV